MPINHRKWMFVSLAFLLPAGCVAPIANLYPPRAGEPVREFYVVSHGWHTGIVIHRDDIPQDIWPEPSEFRKHEYIEIGWGDEAWYRSNKLTIGLFLRAVFLPTDSALHVVGFNRPVDTEFPDSGIIKVTATDRGFKKMMAYIRKSFVIKKDGQPVYLQPGLYGRSKFFKAKGSYSALRTCNRWTADGVRETGAPISTWYTTTATNVIYQCRYFGRVIKER